MKKAVGYCFNHNFGGFGGGYMQLPHLAPTYAAFLTIL
jgi:prenyltransferase beta subunit